MILQVIKKGGRFDLRRVYEAFRGCADGIYMLTVKRVRGNRSNDQNAWLWGCVYPILLDALIDAGWDDFTNIEQVHEFCKSKFTKESSVNKQTGEVVDCRPMRPEERNRTIFQALRTETPKGKTGTND